MLLVLPPHPAAGALPARVNVDHLLRKAAKDGAPAVRGPLVDVTSGAPLAALRDGDKLHVVAAGDGASVGGHGPAELVERLAQLGLAPGARLEQIHLIADDAGVGGAESFAERFAAALAARGFGVQEIKAPRGRVHTDETGKVHVTPSSSDGPQPPGSSLHHYAGPGVQPKHRP